MASGLSGKNGTKLEKPIFLGLTEVVVDGDVEGCRLKE
jgi:hypothetical protein